MSEYQAEWIVDDDEEGFEDEDGEDVDMESDESGDENDDESVVGNERIKMDMQPIDDQMSVVGDAIPSCASTVQDSISMAGIEDVIDEVEVQKFRDEVANLQWPDQVDVPIDQAARERFQRYRGLKSFRFVILLCFYILYF